MWIRQIKHLLLLNECMPAYSLVVGELIAHNSPTIYLLYYIAFAGY